MSDKRPEDFRFLAPETQKCPYEMYRVLREQAPIYREPETGFYIVSRHADIVEAKSNVEVFSNDVNLGAVGKTPSARVQEIACKHYERPQTLHRTDPPTHTHYRSLVDGAFTLPRVRAMIPDIEAVVRELLDGLPENGEVDFVKDYSIPLPCRIIAAQLGLDRKDALKLRLWSDGLLDPVGLMIDEERHVECMHLILEFQEFFAAEIEARRKAPRNDMLSDLSRRIDGEEAYTIPEVLNLLEQIVTGGNETTTSLISSGLLLLIQNPEQERILREEPSRIPNFVEEALRLESPVQSNFRHVKQDFELGGVALPKDSIVVLRYGAANRDERRFGNSETLDVRRTDSRRHVAFGFGVHHCPGSLLARQEAVSTFQELLARYERFELLCSEDALYYHPTFFLRGLEALPVRLVRKR